MVSFAKNNLVIERKIARDVATYSTLALDIPIFDLKSRKSFVELL